MQSRNRQALGLVLFSGSALACAALLGFVAPTYGVMIIAGMIGLAIIALASVRPDIAIIGWLTVSLLVPHWTPIPVGLVFQPSSALAIPVVLGVLIGRIGKPAQFKLNYIDYSVAAAALIVLVQWYVGDLPFVFLKDLIFLWMLAYILGRFAVENTRTAIVVLLSIIAAWGLLEFAFGWHVFENWYPSANHKFNEIQERAGVARSEASIGHAIAYGAVLAMGIPFAQRSGRKAIWIQLLLCAGIIVSLSRGPMLTMVLTLVLTVWVLAESKVRVRYTALALAGSLGVYYVLTALYSGAYSDEVRGSGDQRVNQLDAVGNAVHWMSTAITGNVNGQAVAGNVGIIDSTPLRLAVNFGIIAAVLFIVPILVAAIRSLNRKAGPASVALAGQIPVLVVTSLILQWQVLAFFMMGMVATEISARRVSPPMETTESETTTPVRKSYANRAG